MSVRLLLAAGLLAGLAAPVAAQYKVVGPDGRITYTDRPPAAGAGQVSSIGSSRAAAPADAGAPPGAWPLELRQAASRFPVTLYTTANCPPCDGGRQFLVQRGVPYAERRIVAEEDAVALERLVGGRTVPSLTVGAQALRGFNAGDWTTYLDAAGYPKDSRLPRGWQPAAATPLASREVPPPPPSEPPRPTLPSPVAADPVPATPGSIRF